MIDKATGLPLEGVLITCSSPYKENVFGTPPVEISEQPPQNIRFKKGMYGGTFGRSRSIQRFKTLSSGKDGSFTVSKLMNYSYDIEAVLAGYVKVTKKDIEIANNESVNALVIELEKGGRITGRVIDKDTGIPLPKANVDAYLQNNSDIGTFYGKTDEKGNFMLDGLVDGVYDIKAQYEDYVDAVISGISIKNVEYVADFAIDLKKGGVAEGRVLNKIQGLPLTRIRVNIKCANGRRLYADTGTDGAFEIKGLPDGIYEAIAEKDGYVDGKSAKFTITGGNTVKNLMIEMEETSEISGRVTDKVTGEPIEDVEVSKLYFKDSAPVSDRLCYPTDKNGNFTITGLTEGRYRLDAEKDGYIKSESRIFPVRNGETIKNFKIELAKGFKFAGSIVDESTGLPVDNAFITVLNGKYSRIAFFSGTNTRYRSGPNGLFSVNGLEKTDYALILYAENYPQQKANISVTADINNATIKISAGQTLKTTVKDGAGNALCGKNILLVPAGASGDFKTEFTMLSDLGMLYESVTDDNGEFKLQHILPGKYSAFLSSCEFKGSTPNLDDPDWEIAVMANETTPLVIVYNGTFPQECALRGKVLKSGKPFSTTELKLVNIDTFTTKTITEVSTDGDYSVSLEPGNYQIRTGNTSFDQITVPEQQEFKCDINIPSGRVKGNIKYVEDNSPVPDANVFLLKNIRNEELGMASFVSSYVCAENTGPDGNFAMENLPEGNYILEVGKSDFATARRKLDITGDAGEDVACG